jgi:phytoene synthase
LDLGLDHTLTHELHGSDPDRFWCLVTADPPKRPAVAALLALNQELGRVAEQVTQPMAGFIRLQWWREAVEEARAGRPRKHPVAQALPLVLQAGLPVQDIEALIDAREREVDDTPIASLEELVTHARATAGGLQRVVAAITGGDPGRGERIGTAYGLIGILRATGYLARRSRTFLPSELLQARGVSRDRILAGQMSDGLASVVKEVLAAAKAEIEGLRPLRGEPATPLLLIDRYQARAIERGGHDPFAAATVERPPLLAARLLLLQTTGL